MPIDIISNDSENAMKNEEIIDNKAHLENTNNNPNNNNINNNDNNPNNNDSLLIAEANIREEDLKIIVNEIRFKDQLRNKGFGEVFDNEFILNSLETLYLLSNNKIKLLGKKDYNFSSFLHILLKKDKKILTKYLIFRDLRSKGYVVKEGFGFGTDFRIYERGEHGKKPSKYVSIGINEGLSIKSKDFVDTIDQIEKMGKDTVIAVIERRGEVIYYKTIKMSFFENKKKS
ncbi:MAG TPA: tRNA-intron lyase [Candidatus Nitrosocosmicus sp.]|nr:tRNA-intron lyase [Candidatus Nitrosocosmicus sp.]